MSLWLTKDFIGHLLSDSGGSLYSFTLPNYDARECFSHLNTKRRGKLRTKALHQEDRAKRIAEKPTESDAIVFGYPMSHFFSGLSVFAAETS